MAFHGGRTIKHHAKLPYTGFLNQMKAIRDWRIARKASKAALALLLIAGGGVPADALTADEDGVLRVLCRAGLSANGGTWASERINGAIATLAFGREWPDGPQATAYKTCNAGGYLG